MMEVNKKHCAIKSSNQTPSNNIIYKMIEKLLPILKFLSFISDKFDSK